MSRLPVLVVEDDADLREALCDTLALAGYVALAAADGEAALRLLERKRVGLVVSDVQMHPMDGHALLRAIKASQGELPVILMTAYGMIDRAVEAMQAGACTYLTKPFEPDRLLAEIERFYPAEGDAPAAEICVDAASGVLFELARRVAQTDATVLLAGESGTGKEVVARFIHRHSARAARPFVAINCAAIPENLLESTLFGHEKGAFTGSVQAQAGKFEQAQGGTLLLDEISEMPMALQAKLLRVLQEREVERVGGHKAIRLDIRVIATSNRDLPAEVARGSFREDLYYRLNVFPLEVPPLRARRADIEALARHFLDRQADRLGRPGLCFSPAACRALEAYDWPGNIRELENVVQRAMILAPALEIGPADLHLPAARGDSRAASEPAKIADARPADMRSLEKEHILGTLRSVAGSRREAARVLGMSERTLRYKLQQYRAEGEVV